MRILNTLIWTVVCCGMASVASAEPLGLTAFTIAPAVSSVTVYANGESRVAYTVTNNANSSLSGLSITPGYQSSGYGLSLTDNGCGSSLSAGGRCTFSVLISGSTSPAQPSVFSLTPRICVMNGFLCSVATTPVTVSVSSSSLPVRAYEEIASSDINTSTLEGINIDNTSDVITAPLNYVGANNSVAISADGSTVYATNEVLTGDTPGVFVKVFHASATGLSVVDTIPILYSGCHINTQLALSPDGSSLFVTAYTTVCEGHDPRLGTVNAVLDRINTRTDSVTAITGSVVTRPGGIAISPDGSTVYVGNQGAYILAFSSSATSLDSSNEITGASILNEDHPGLAINAAGNRLYVTNRTTGSVAVLSVNGTSGSSVGSLLSSDFAGAIGVAISPDGENLYVAETTGGYVVKVPVNDPASGQVQGVIEGAYGVALTPDASQLYVTQTAGTATTVLNAKVFFAIPTRITTGGASRTLGDFIGP